VESTSGGACLRAVLFVKFREAAAEFVRLIFQWQAEKRQTQSTLWSVQSGLQPLEILLETSSRQQLFFSCGGLEHVFLKYSRGRRCCLEFFITPRATYFKGHH